MVVYATTTLLGRRGADLVMQSFKTRILRFEWDTVEPPPAHRKTAFAMSGRSEVRASNSVIHRLISASLSNGVLPAIGSHATLPSNETRFRLLPQPRQHNADSQVPYPCPESHRATVGDKLAENYFSRSHTVIGGRNRHQTNCPALFANGPLSSSQILIRAGK
jgi:hypothetical protein